LLGEKGQRKRDGEKVQNEEGRARGLTLFIWKKVKGKTEGKKGSY